MPKRKRQRKNRYRLLLYDRFFDRYRLLSLIMCVGLFVAWFATSTELITLPFLNISNLFLSVTILFFVFWLFTMVGPLLAYTQAEDEFLLIQTPLYRVLIPYHHILNTRPVEVRKVYPPSNIAPGQNSLLKPLFGHTALAVDLHQFPSHNLNLNLFFHRLTFSPEVPGLILLVEDWMGLSNQLSDRLDAWRMAHSDHVTQGASDAANILRNHDLD